VAVLPITTNYHILWTLPRSAASTEENNGWHFSNKKSKRWFFSIVLPSGFHCCAYYFASMHLIQKPKICNILL